MKLSVVLSILAVAAISRPVFAFDFSCTLTEFDSSYTQIYTNTVSGTPCSGDPHVLQAVVDNVDGTLELTAHGARTGIAYVLDDMTTNPPTELLNVDIPGTPSINLDYDESNGNTLEVTCDVSEPPTP